MIPLWLLGALALIIGLTLAMWLRAAHLNCRLYAELSHDWEERGRFYDAQLEQLRLTISTAETAKEPLVKFTVYFLRQHYTESSESAWAWAERYASRIPIGVRAWYLRTTG